LRIGCGKGKGGRGYVLDLQVERKISLKNRSGAVWSFQNSGYASKFYLCSSFTPYIIRTIFPENKNQEGKLSERGDGSLCLI
jgi:hypothetical protein